jgi:MoaA/NifB/PqqE/SkfB family radical SAM enzyme
MVVNDLVIAEDSCNLSCEYCLTGQSMFKQQHLLQRIFDPPRPNSCLPGTDLHDRLQAILDSVATQDIPVVKISGGEVFLVRGIMAFIEHLSARYETVVVLTNGLLLTDNKLARLKQLGNIVLQMSLDATRYAGNSYRVRSEDVHNKVMERIYRILEHAFPTEIYTVLNDRSIGALEQTYEDLLPYAAHTTVFPFPVRGPTREKFLPKPDQYPMLRKVIDQAQRYGSLIPSRPYLDRLWSFFRDGGRTFRCHLPRIAFTSFDDGKTTSCPNIWFNDVGNLVEESADAVFGRLKTNKFRQLLLADRPRIDACKACYTPWDPVSLYFEGQLTLDELAHVPIYRGPKTKARLAAIRDAYLAEERDHAQHHYSDAQQVIPLTPVSASARRSNPPDRRPV